MIITISRQYGSGGSQVAKILAERMGVWCYDRDILTIAAERIGNEELSEDTINDHIFLHMHLPFIDCELVLVVYVLRILFFIVSVNVQFQQIISFIFIKKAEILLIS